MKKCRNTLLKSLSLLVSFMLFSFNYGKVMTEIRNLPNAYYAETFDELNGELSILEHSSGLSVTASSTSDETLPKHTVTCKLFGMITIKTMDAYISERVDLIPCGQAVGISIHTSGVMVIGISTFVNSDGKKCSPADEAGLRAGDVILSISGIKISTAEQLQTAISDNPAKSEIQIDREGKNVTLFVTPQRSSDGEYRMGAWVRDSTVGVGTLSFYVEDNGLVAALGHAVIDADTGRLITVRDGLLVYADIVGVSRGVEGVPGELHGTFHAESEQVGTIVGNTELGIYGYSFGDIGTELGRPMPVAYPDEVQRGDAYILTTIDGSGVQAFACRIIKTLAQDEPAPKGLVVEITDSRLLDRTGGIVQGMSGSPIIQNGMLVGVVTHVFVNDPSKGYGAYAYWMLNSFG